MDFAALSDVSVQLALWIGVLSAILSIGLLVEIIVMRGFLLAQKVRKHRLVTHWQPLLVRSVAGEEPDLPAVPRRDLIDFLLLWLRFQKTVRGEAGLHLNRLLQRLSVETEILALLHKGQLDERLIAISVLGFLGSKSAWTPLTVMVRDPLTVLSITCARALLRIDEREAIAHIIPLIAQRRDWTVGRTAVMLKEADQVFVDAFVAAVEQAEKERQPNLLRLMRILDILQLSHPLPFLRHMLSHSDNPDLLSAALKLVSNPADLDLVRRLAESPNWSVQVQVAAVLGRLGDRADLPILLKLMHSGEWWVRYRAAQAYIQMPFVTEEEIASVRQGLSDTFAQDILAHTLAEQVES